MFKIAFMIGVFALSASAVRADDDEEATSAETPAAAAAARDKGYRAEKPTQATTKVDEEDAPVSRPSASQGGLTPPPQRPLGAAERKAASSSGGGASSAAGISCEKSEPPLARVIRIDDPEAFNGSAKQISFSYGPNEAISYKFIAQKSVWGGFTVLGHVSAGAQTPMLMSVSETPCDFNVEKSMARAEAVGPAGLKQDPCYLFTGGEGTLNFAAVGTALPRDGAGAIQCRLKPGKTYYYNMRSYEGGQDACAKLAKTHPGIKCGGIWRYYPVLVK